MSGWVAIAERNMAADDWVEPVPLRVPPFGMFEGHRPPTAVQEARFAEHLHPRDRLGHWAVKPGASHPTVRQTVVGGDWEAVDSHGDVAVRSTRAEAEHAKDAMSGAAMKGDPGREGVPFVDFPDEPFTRDPALVAQARALILSGAPTTRDRYAHVRGNVVVYDRSREALHRKIIDTLIGDHKTPPGRKPYLFFTGGAYASGKGAVVDGHPPHPWKPADAVTIDPDKVKAMLPEFGELTTAGDPEANLRVYEEAWDVSQALADEVRSRHLDVIVDGVGNTSVSEVMGRVHAWERAGYGPPKGVYVATPTDVAITNARKRLEGAQAKGKLESIRYIPDDIMRSTHENVSRVFPGILREWPGELELYDTNTWNAARGEFDPPRLILRKAAGGTVDVLDQETYQAFLDKADGHEQWPTRAV